MHIYCMSFILKLNQNSVSPSMTVSAVCLDKFGFNGPVIWFYWQINRTFWIKWITVGKNRLLNSVLYYRAAYFWINLIEKLKQPEELMDKNLLVTHLKKLTITQRIQQAGRKRCCCKQKKPWKSCRLHHMNLINERQ